METIQHRRQVRPASRARTLTGIGLAIRILLALWATGGALAAAQSLTSVSAIRELTLEVSHKGWILFSAQTPRGDYDLFLCRPDGLGLRNLTQSPEWDEFGGRFSPDGQQMLYRRLAHAPNPGPESPLNRDQWGALGTLVLANADGSEPEPQGQDGGWPWASWGPDGRQIACLHGGQGQIRLFELATKKLVKTLPRRGIFQQMYWSPDGKALCGTANHGGEYWNIVSVSVTTGQATLLTRGINCTSDWFQGDSNRVIYSHRHPGLGDEYGWTMLMQATADGKSRTLIYGERARHIYYGCTSPDDRYVIFACPRTDDAMEANLAVIRLADAPIIVPESYTELRALYPAAKTGPVLRLRLRGFEPHWTYAEIGVP